MKRLLLTGLLAVATCVGARAVDVSGTYENAGAMVGPGLRGGGRNHLLARVVQP